ncbi:MAG: tripartite tricarboxylate transporter family receptor [Hyphomicrobiales bacterium]|nr:tripartite tricarboxylate transporter family receptor [Hyphomicrobiales bacterium]
MRPAFLAALWIAAATPSAAQTSDDFYKDRTISISVGYLPGGGYDLHARALARFIGGHVPGKPNVVVKNVPGGAGLTLLNWFYNQAPKDGTEIATFDRGLALEPLIGSSNIKFDPLKLNWIGSPVSETSTCVAWHTSPVKTLADLMTTELLVGGTAPAADNSAYPRVLNALLGTKFKVVSGYKESSEAILAMERGETSGFCAWGWSTIQVMRPDWLSTGKIRVLVQLGLEKPADHQDIPLALDLTRNELDRAALALMVAPQQFARPFAAPPGVPPARVATLRAPSTPLWRMPNTSPKPRAPTWMCVSCAAKTSRRLSKNFTQRRKPPWRG